MRSKAKQIVPQVEHDFHALVAPVDSAGKHNTGRLHKAEGLHHLHHVAKPLALGLL